VYLALAGLMLGSFINLTADRLPRGESIIKPRSYCRGCGRRLNVIDLVPVLGYLIRAGRCATCRTSIGLSAPIVEAISGACVAVPLLLYGLWPGAMVGAVLVSVYGAAVTGLSMRRFGRQGAKT